MAKESQERKKKEAVELSRQNADQAKRLATVKSLTDDGD